MELREKIKAKSNPCDRCQHWDCCAGCLEKIVDDYLEEQDEAKANAKKLGGKEWLN